ncbi:probable 26S proteasome non-ATPase regulatory subunit 3 [Olea europaea subsp. europaea]|uniref:Probable 26S proteasome non-ATPase regulatory subunit 3 n=1 Tax=Olea europaea subsp. europaea TaxID=158383 RepID=A0A8S0RAH2_OLEEU|nr:probable 26S proteasome non-ATPase regulatory subunit 3 [Olea europaea subsp. europaea]
MTQDVEMNNQQHALSYPLSSTAPSVRAYARELRRIVRAIRWTIQLRRKLKASVLSAFLNYVLVPGSELHSRLYSYLPEARRLLFRDDRCDISANSLPELEIYCCLLILIFLIHQKRYSEAKACSSASIARLKNLNRRTVDVLASRLYFYYSLSYELTGDLAEIRGNLLALHRTATLHLTSWDRKHFSICY